MKTINIGLVSTTIPLDIVIWKYIYPQIRKDPTILNRGSRSM